MTIIRDVDYPMCDLCGRPVEDLYQVPDILNRATIVTVFCHGEKESVRIDDVTLHEMIPGSIKFGRAFTISKIENDLKLND